MKMFFEKLKYWLFQKNKGCHACCLFCDFYDICKSEVESNGNL